MLLFPWTLAPLGKGQCFYCSSVFLVITAVPATEKMLHKYWLKLVKKNPQRRLDLPHCLNGEFETQLNDLGSHIKLQGSFKNSVDPAI